MQTIKSNQYLEYDKILHMERYKTGYEEVLRSGIERSDAIDAEILELRKQVSILECQEESFLIDVAPGGSRDLVKISATNASPTTALPQKINCNDGILNKKGVLRQKIDSLIADRLNIFAGLTANDYHLFGVFIHEGEANFGHFCLYLFDSHHDQWFKYNDSSVTKSTEEQVFANTTGKNYNALSLIYIKTSEIQSTTSLILRIPEFHNQIVYQNKIL